MKKPLNGRKIEAMHKIYGEDPKGRNCQECPRFFEGEYHNRNYFKCSVYGLSRSESTDWRKSWTACSLFDEPFPQGELRVIDRIKPPKKPEPEIRGQISMLEVIDNAIY